MIVKYDNGYHRILQFCIIHYQAQWTDHHRNYRIGHHQEHYHPIQKYHMKYIDHFESSLLYQNQNYERFQEFNPCLIDCEQRPKIL